nr:unnamed protein product [Spirometra erinaceieuropaei]
MAPCSFPGHQPLREAKSSAVVTGYTRPMTNAKRVRKKFYNVLHAFLGTVLNVDKLSVLTDFNARVGTDHVDSGAEGDGEEFLILMDSAAPTKTASSSSSSSPSSSSSSSSCVFADFRDPVETDQAA